MATDNHITFIPTTTTTTTTIDNNNNRHQYHLRRDLAVSGYWLLSAPGYLSPLYRLIE
jgi:hypothetical protein